MKIFILYAVKLVLETDYIYTAQLEMKNIFMDSCANLCLIELKMCKVHVLLLITTCLKKLNSPLRVGLNFLLIGEV